MVIVCNEELSNANRQHDLDMARQNGVQQEIGRRREIGVHAAVDPAVNNMLSGIFAEKFPFSELHCESCLPLSMLDLDIERPSGHENNSLSSYKHTQAAKGFFRTISLHLSISTVD